MIINNVVERLMQYDHGHRSAPHVWITLYALVRQMNPQNLVEIGSYDGGSLLSMVQALKDNNANNAKIYEFDIWELGTKEIVEKNIEEAGLGNFIELNTGDSLVTVPERLKTVPLLDFNFIDGNHGYDHAMTDFKNVYARTNKGGLIALHDTNWCSDTVRVGQEIMAKYKNVIHFMTPYREGAHNRGLMLVQKME